MKHSVRTMAARKSGPSGPTKSYEQRLEQGQRTVQIRCDEALQARVAKLKAAKWQLAEILEAGVIACESGLVKKST